MCGRGNFFWQKCPRSKRDYINFWAQASLPWKGHIYRSILDSIIHLQLLCHRTLYQLMTVWGMEGFTFPGRDNAVFPFLGWLGKEGKEDRKFDQVIAHAKLVRDGLRFWIQPPLCVPNPLSIKNRCFNLFYWCHIPEVLDVVSTSCPPFYKDCHFSRAAGLLQLLLLHWFPFFFFFNWQRNLSRIALQLSACVTKQQQKTRKHSLFGVASGLTAVVEIR